jgi:hypothetical protein
MIATIILLLGAAWMLYIGSALKVTSGGTRGVLLFKTLPIGLAFGLVLVGLKLI